jgi:fructokinase
MKVELRDKIKIDTVSPEETLHQIVLFLRKHPIEEIGIASFGPLDLN